MNLRCLSEESDCWWNLRLGEGWVGSGTAALKWSLLNSATLEGTCFILSSSHPSWFVVLSLFMAVLVARSLCFRNQQIPETALYILFHQNIPIS